MTTLESLLKELEEKANAATPGPWEAVYDDSRNDVLYEVGPLSAAEYYFDIYKNRAADVNYICFANPNTIKKLISVIKTLIESMPHYGRITALEECEKIVSGE